MILKNFAGTENYAVYVAKMSESWLFEKLKSLKVKERCLSTLREIHDRIHGSNFETKKRLLTSPELYDCLDEFDEELGSGVESCFFEGPAEVVSDILLICLDDFPLSHRDFPRVVHRALLHKERLIKIAALDSLLKKLHLLNGVGVFSNAISDELLHDVLTAVQDEDTKVGMTAVIIVGLVLEGHLEKPSVKETLLKSLNKCEMVRCRLYEIAVKVGAHSAEALEKVEFILDHALSELDNDDILTQMNVLEILSTLAEHDYGILYMEKRQVLDVIGKRIEEIDQNPFDELIIQPILQFFSEIARVQPRKIVIGHPQIMRYLFECLMSDNVSTFSNAFNDFAIFASTPQGVLLLEENYATSVQDAFAKCVCFLRSMPSEMKLNTLTGWKFIFTFESTVDNQISTILERWFHYLTGGCHNMQFLMEYCRNPFPDIKTFAFQFVVSLCAFPWGIEAVKNTAGFLEYLLDRNVEFDFEVKYVKYCLIKILADSDAFDAQTNILLRTYVNEGPNFLMRMLGMAVERNE